MGCVMSVERAQADLKRVNQEASRLKIQLLMATERITKLEHYIELAKVYDANADGVTDNKPQNGSSLVAASIEIIAEAGVRQPTRHLVEELERRGHVIGGQNKVTNLSGTLSRAPELTASRTEGWGLAAWDSSHKAKAEAQPSEPSEPEEGPPWAPSDEDSDDAHIVF